MGRKEAYVSLIGMTSALCLQFMHFVRGTLGKDSDESGILGTTVESIKWRKIHSTLTRMQS
jgi:hypothetical protein